MSRGNVFADLELPDAKEAMAKAEPARRICAIFAERKPNPHKAFQVK